MARIGCHRTSGEQFGTALSVAFLGETFTVVQLAGAVITIVGALLAVTQKEKVQGDRPRVAA
jgi:drug/metabolite transporter (DMT)-like permease